MTVILPPSRTRVDASPLHGRGLYASDDLAPDETAVEVHALVLDPRSTDDLAGHPLERYLVSWDDERSALPLGDLSFVNHAPTPNAELVVDHDRGTVSLIVRRQVRTGEELTIDYGEDHPL